MPEALIILLSGVTGILAIIGVIAAIDWLDKSNDDEWNPWK